MNDQTISVVEAKKRFSEILGKVAYGNEKILITKRGRPMARLIPVEQNERHLAEAKGWLDEKAPFFSMMDVIVRDRKKHTPRSLKQGTEK